MGKGKENVIGSVRSDYGESSEEGQHKERTKDCRGTYIPSIRRTEHRVYRFVSHLTCNVPAVLQRQLLTW